jgi:thioredoxin 1
MSDSEILKSVDDENFEKAIAKGVTLVDFYADWCGPCRMLHPVIEEVAKEMSDVAFVKVDIDKNQKSASMMQVTSVPTVVLFKEGKEVSRLVGLRDSNGIKQFITSGK